VDFNQKKAAVIQQYQAVAKDASNVTDVEASLMPCIGAFSTQDTKKSKIGGFPDVPEGFQWPNWNGRPLTFLCQLDCAALNNLDIQNRLPNNGLISIFAYLKDEQGRLTLPEQELGQVQGFHFHENENLQPLAIEENLLSELRETFIDFHAYADLPENGDYRFPKGKTSIDEDLVVQFDLLPQVYDLEDSPSMKILGYPNDDAMNTFYWWYLQDQGLDYTAKGIDIEHHNQVIQDFELLLSVGLSEMNALKLEDEYVDFGGISLGIKRANLAEGNFQCLYFKYTIS
jgi:hypothetical protein